MDARAWIHVIHDITGDAPEPYQKLVARISREVHRGGERCAEELLYHMSGRTENGWRATEHWRYRPESYAARDDAAERLAKELGVGVRIYDAEFVYRRPKR